MNISELICYVLDYLDSNLYNDINNDELSNYFGYDKTYLIKKFKNETDFTIRGYVNIRKIFNSLEMLLRDERLLKVALESGYNSLEYYSEIFTKILTINPSSFRKLMIKINTVSNYVSNIEEYNAALSKLLTAQEVEVYNIFKSLEDKLDSLDKARSKKDNKILRLEIPNKGRMVA